MALTNCPECGGKNRYTTKSCIHCSFELNTHSQNPSEHLRSNNQDASKNSEPEYRATKSGCSYGCLQWIVVFAIVPLLLGANFFFGFFETIGFGNTGAVLSYILLLGIWLIAAISATIARSANDEDYSLADDVKGGFRATKTCPHCFNKLPSYFTTKCPHCTADL